MAQINSNVQAYEYAKAEGLRYRRQRIGYSIYESTTHTLEIGHDKAVLYTRGKQPKSDRLVSIHRYTSGIGERDA